MVAEQTIQHLVAQMTKEYEFSVQRGSLEGLSSLIWALLHTASQCLVSAGIASADVPSVIPSPRPNPRQGRGGQDLTMERSLHQIMDLSWPFSGTTAQKPSHALGPEVLISTPGTYWSHVQQLRLPSLG